MVFAVTENGRVEKYVFVVQRSYADVFPSPRLERSVAVFGNNESVFVA